MKKVKLHTSRGETKTLGEWARTMGLPVSVLRGRMRRGWTLDELVEAQANSGDALTYRGETMPIDVWFRKLGIDPRVLKMRLADGASVKNVLLLPRLRHTTHPHARRVEIAGSSKTIAEWAKERGVDKKRLRRRLDSGWIPQFAVEVK